MCYALLVKLRKLVKYIVSLPKRTMKKEYILALLLVFSVLLGAVNSYLEAHHINEPLWWHFGSTFVAIGLIFAWYHADSTLRSYRRSKLLNIGVFAFAAVALPYYLIRSRERGQKGKAILKLIGFFVVVLICGALGAMLASFIG